MLTIGYDAKRLFSNFTGLGNYSRTLLRNLVNYYPDCTYFLYTTKVKKNEETQFFLNSAHFNVRMPERRPKAYWRSVGVKKILQKDRIQLYHGLSHEIPVGIQKTGIKSIVTIHDLIFRLYPKQYRWLDRRIYDSKFQYACQHADRVVAISESTKKDIVDLYQIDPDKISVIYQSCHDRFQQEKAPNVIKAVLEKYRLPGDFLLYVGSIIERKNLLNIVKALEILPKDMQLPLVVVGKGGEYKTKVVQYLRQKKMESQVLFIRPDFEDLPALYQQAQIFLYPSFYEGFGIPILEALYSKTPVITSNVSSLPEAAGPDSLQVDPASFGEIAQGIEQILSDELLQNKMAENGFAYAKRFDGESLTTQMMDLYQEVVGVDVFGV